MDVICSPPALSRRALVKSLFGMTIRKHSSWTSKEGHSERSNVDELLFESVLL